VLNRNVEDTISQFAERIRESKVVFFVGAGISNGHPSHLPLAGQLMETIYRILYKKSDFFKVGTAKTKNNYLIEEDFVKLFLSKSNCQIRFESLLQILSDTLQSLDVLQVFKSKQPNNNHKFLAEAIIGGNQVITTNFDTLIESSFKKNNKIKVIATDNEFKGAMSLIGKKPLLFKIHGTLDDKGSLKATLKQVGSAGLAFMWEPAKAAFMEKIVSEYHLIFLGYSGTDDLDIMSKLSITEFNKEALWISHSSCEPKLILPNKLGREFDDEILLNFLNKHNITVIKGNTDIIVKELSQRSSKHVIKNKARLGECRCRHRLSYRKHLVNCLDRWNSTNPGLIDFLISRLLYMANQPQKALNILDYLKKKFRVNLDYENYAQTLTNMAVIEEELGLHSEALNHIENANLLHLAQGNLIAFCDSSYNVATFRIRDRKYKEAESILKRIIALSKKLKLYPQYAKAISSMGLLLRVLDRYDEAILSLKKAYETYKKLGDHQGCAIVFSNMGEVLYAKGKDYEASLIFFRMAYEEAKRTRDSIFCVKILLNMGATHLRVGNVVEAENAYSKGMKIAKQIGHIQYQTVCELGYCRIALFRGEIDKAISLSNRIIPKAKKCNLYDRIAELKGNIGLFLMEKRKYHKALSFFNKARMIYKKYGNDPRLLAFTYQNIGECLFRLNDVNKANNAVKKSIKILESIGREKEAKEALSLLH